jgi:N6-L-threonylcarbamoyladenine synthase
VLYFIRDELKKDNLFIEKNKNDICASVQKTIVDILFTNLAKASEETGIHEVAIAGGVSANSGLRNRLTAEGEKRNWNVYLPKPEYCTDNAAMIAIAAYYKFLKKDFASQEIAPLARYGF